MSLAQSEIPTNLVRTSASS